MYGRAERRRDHVLRRRAHGCLDAVRGAGTQDLLLDPELDGQRAPVHKPDELAGLHTLQLTAIAHRLHVGEAELVPRGEHNDPVDGTDDERHQIGVPVDHVLLAREVELDCTGVERGVGNAEVVGPELADAHDGRQVRVEHTGCRRSLYHRREGKEVPVARYAGPGRGRAVRPGGALPEVGGPVQAGAPGRAVARTCERDYNRTGGKQQRVPHANLLDGATASERVSNCTYVGARTKPPLSRTD